MLRSTKDLEGYAIQATDGTIGHVKDFYFDNEMWVIRYLIVDTGTWLESREVLISPIAIGQPNWEENVLSVTLTKAQVKNSPDIDTDKPVSRQHEIHYFGYYGYPFYWGGTGLWGTEIYPNMMMLGYAGLIATPPVEQPEVEQAESTEHQDEDPHLHSCDAIVNYHIMATDGDIGHVQGMLVDEETWAIRYLIVDTSNWWLGHQVLIAPQWIEGVSWHDTTVSVSLTRQEVKDAPPYDAAVPLDRDQEFGIFKHYGRPGYWAGDVKHAAGNHTIRSASKVAAKPQERNDHVKL